MITNIPKVKDFENVAKQCLTQAFNIVFEEDRHFVYDEGLPRDKFWEYHLAHLNTAIILVYQGIESLLKSQICSESALLLIELKRQDWPTGPVSDDKDFNDLFTISGESLTKTYSATLKGTNIDNSLVNFIEEVRIARNRIMHGASHNIITPEYVVEIILKTFNYFLGKDSWWNTTRELLINNPIFGIYNEDYEEADFIERLDYVEELIGKGKFDRQFEMNLKCRRYLCPWCWDSLGQEGQDLESSWGFLIPQKTRNVTEIECLNCQRKNTVIRKNCADVGCKGNVIFENKDKTEICLTCGLCE